MSWFRNLDTIVQRAIMAAALFSVLVVILLTHSYCSERDRLKQATAGKTLSDGRTAAAQDASAIRDEADARIAEINQTVEDATHAIRNAPDPASRDRAALVGLCRIDPSASPDCRLLNADPGRVD